MELIYDTLISFMTEISEESHVGKYFFRCNLEQNLEFSKLVYFFAFTRMNSVFHHDMNIFLVDMTH